MANENLLATIDAVCYSDFSRWEKTPYRNRHNIWGWHFRFWYSQWQFISVHNCSAPLTQRSIVDAIKGIEFISDTKWGIYANGKDIPGFYATARSTRAIDGSLEHWIMIGRSAERNFRSLLLRKRNLEPEESDLLKYLENNPKTD